MKLGILASGKLGFEILQLLFKKHEITFVLTDHGSHDLVSFVESLSLPLFVGNPRRGKAKDFIKDKSIDVLVSINYLYLIEEDLINLPSKCAFNIHGSLLPKYRGRTPHVWSIINGESTAGVSAHLITTGCDEGDILEQVSVAIEDKDTGNSLLNKLKSLYPGIIEKVLEQIENDSLTPKAQDHTKHSFFGKRTPEDGKIHWSWQKERIRNWVRAQSDPYPGAFTFCDGRKIIIDEISYSASAYCEDIPDGYVLSTSPFLIKTPNGVVRLDRVRDAHVEFVKTGDVLE